MLIDEARSKAKELSSLVAEVVGVQGVIVVTERTKSMVAEFVLVLQVGQNV